MQIGHLASEQLGHPRDRKGKQEHQKRTSDKREREKKRAYISNPVPEQVTKRETGRKREAGVSIDPSQH